MATILRMKPFSEKLLPLVANFDCARDDPATAWEEEINEWIVMKPESKDGALFSMTKAAAAAILSAAPFPPA